ncbi:MAG: hypothetical protein GF393_09915 [Armatimonadia bacterium]|nr:hypothetical protein [Armatimonadia bacterium]
MERLGSLFWSGVTMVALLGIVSSVAAPIALASPIVKITDPGHEQVVRGEIVIDVTYRSDSDQPITRLDLLIDDEVVSQYAVNPPSVSGTQAFKWTFDAPNGSKHSIGARAVDAAGEVGMASITVTVASAESSGPAGQDRIPPVINIYYPAQGAELSGEVEIKAEATDNEGVMAVFFYLDGKFHTAIMNTGPYTARWDTTKMSDGPHVIQGKVMDQAENESASAEVTVFVKNRDMTTASAQSLAAPGTAPVAPSVGVQQPGLTQTEFATPSEPLMAMDTDNVEAEGARVGYLPPIGDREISARTSSPRLISALPRDMQPEPAHQLSTQDETAEALAVATTHEPIAEHQIASNELAPRLTVPRRLAATDHVVTPMTDSERAAEPVSPQVATVDSLQRMTLPRTEIASGATTDMGVELKPGPVALEPILQVSPGSEKLAARMTTPGLSLVPSEQLAADDTTAEALVVSGDPQADWGSVAATIDSRTTMPERTLQPTSADLRAFRPLEGDTDSMRIAVLPERASRAAIPADGRMTLPGQPTIAPVASMAFEQVKVLFDNETLEMLTPPEMAEGISIAPLREIFEHSDGVLYWYPVEKRVKATRPGTEMNLQIGDPQVQVNNETRTLQVAPYIKHGRTMVPLQFLADTLDVTVTFNPESGQICLTSNDF